MKRIIILVLAGLMAAPLLWAEKKTAPEQASETIFEKALDENISESLLNVIYGEAEMTVREAKKLKVKGLEKKRDSEKIKVKYPRVLVTKDFIRFLDNSGNKKFERKLSSNTATRGSDVKIAKNNKFILHNHFIDKQMEEIESEMFDPDGNLLWKKKHHLFEVSPSPDGTYFMGAETASYGRGLFVYLNDGSVKEIKSDTNSCDFAFSKNGDYFVVTLEMIDKEKQKLEIFEGSYVSYLALFNRECKELWKKRIGTEINALVLFSEKDKIEVATNLPSLEKTDMKKYTYDKDGKLLNVLDDAREFYARLAYKKRGARVSKKVLGEKLYQKIYDEKKN